MSADYELPNFKELQALKGTYEKCVGCQAPFSDANTHTEAGWRETQISGLCEDCFDAVCSEPDDEEQELEAHELDVEIEAEERDHLNSLPAPDEGPL